VPALPEEIGAAVDLAGCPNRCRHCYLGRGPERKLPRDVLCEAPHSAGGFRVDGKPATLAGSQRMAGI